MRKTLLVTCYLLFHFGFHDLLAQGCSDAGICTLRSFKSENKSAYIPYKNQFNIGLSNGNADHSIFILGPYLGYTRNLNEKLSVDAKLTFLFQSGNNISVGGPGDIFANINYKIFEKWTLTAGAKIPLTDGGKFFDSDHPLPMDYQSSLGTLDLLAGIGYQSSALKIILGYQQPVHQNQNWFAPDGWATDSPLHMFQNTFGFQRKGDILMRISHSFGLNEKINFIPGILPIYHLGDDQYYDYTGFLQSISGSKGLTLNATLDVNFELNQSSRLNFNIGFPLIIRDARPDGLTRSYVMTSEFTKYF